ncbi:MAG: transglutaminase-like domain-containing protein [Oscillospiraceae bacterium]|nr:transglutaminase-like domain-containing protein [Oscillospiraceae bacterium]
MMFNQKLKRTAVFAVLCVLFTVWCQTGILSVASDYQATLSRVYTLEITHDLERFVRLTASGNKISAEGFFKNETVVDFYIAGAAMLDNTSKSFKVNFNGAFTAEYSGTSTASNAYSVIQFENGDMLFYRVEYDKGWFFGDNGLGSKTMQAVENYFTAAPEVNAHYVNPRLEPEEIAGTLKKLQEIADEVTEGIDDDYQKAKALNFWVCENIYYDRDARDSEVTEETVSLTNTLKLRRSVCIGIANIYGALLEAAGIKAVNIKGGVVAPTEGCTYEELPYKTVIHEWVAFWYEAENRWVYADPTWDRRGFFQNGKADYAPSLIKHFDISPLALSFDHRGDKAELRQYFKALEIFEEKEPEPPEINEEIPEEPVIPVNPDNSNNIEEAGDEPVSVPQLPVNTTVPPVGGIPENTPVSAEPAENNIILYALIGGMSLTAVILGFIVIRLRK